MAYNPVSHLVGVVRSARRSVQLDTFSVKGEYIDKNIKISSDYSFSFRAPRSLQAYPGEPDFWVGFIGQTGGYPAVPAEFWNYGTRVWASSQ